MIIFKKNRKLFLLLALCMGMQPVVECSEIEQGLSDFFVNLLADVSKSVICAASVIVISFYLLRWLNEKPEAISSMENEHKKITFEDCVNVPEQLIVLSKQLDNRQVYKDMNVPLPSGMLLYGPPGGGKTYLASALAGSIKCPFIACNAAEFAQKYVGKSGQMIRDTFAQAKKEAENGIAIIFIDEIDGIGDRNSFVSSVGSKETITALLSAMNGIDKDDTCHIIVIAATNCPEKIDEAIRRSGRFDYKIEISYPDIVVRTLMFEKNLEIYPSDGFVNAGMLATITEGLSPADIKFVCEEAGRIAIGQDLKSRDRASYILALHEFRNNQLRESCSNDIKCKRIKKYKDKLGIVDLSVDGLLKCTGGMAMDDIKLIFKRAEQWAVRCKRETILADDVAIASLSVEETIRAGNSQKIIENCEVCYGAIENDHKNLYDKSARDIVNHFAALCPLPSLLLI